MSRKRAPSRGDRWRAAVEELRTAMEAVDAAVGDANSAADALSEVREEYQEWLDNLPEGLRSSPVGEKLEAVTGIDTEVSDDVDDRLVLYVNPDSRSRLDIEDLSASSMQLHARVAAPPLWPTKGAPATHEDATGAQHSSDGGNLKEVRAMVPDPSAPAQALTYAVRDVLAHIERGEGRDSFGQLKMRTLCGKSVDLTGRRPGHMIRLSNPMFYRVCGNCRRIQRQREAKALRHG